MHRVDRRIARIGAGLAPLVIASGWLLGWSLDPGHSVFVPPAARASTAPPATSAPRTFESVAPTPVQTAPRPIPAAAPSLPAPPAPPAATTSAAAPTTPPTTTAPPTTTPTPSTSSTTPKETPDARP